jgi:23S rRNA pseudouridine2605 synthase
MAKKSEKPRASQLEIVEETPEAAPKARKSRAKKAAEPPAPSETSKAAPKKAAKPRKAKVKIKLESGEEHEIQVPVGEPFQHSGNDPIGDVTDGEGRHAGLADDENAETEDSPLQAEMAAHRADAADAALDGPLEDQLAQLEPEEDEAEAAPEPGPGREPGHLDRLQKILSQAGISSRRHAEELITEGRVQVNGQVVTQLGAKADAARDHIRVDGKLISGAERHRYYVLNKPKGYVTTVSDPEGRPTVMHFFEKMRERLYPVGRLDYLSEGLLLVTNDGELANQLTRAASGVEKTYLVKVAGQPTEEQLDLLRSGVAIDRERAGSGKVHTSPARISQVRQGDNPWFEVVLIEGRNRELRKMFSAVGHFVEKIRRVGYGPLVLDLEPGNFRELDPQELVALRLAAEGKWKPRRPKVAKIPPKEASHAPEQSGFKPKSRDAKPFREQTGRRESRGWKPREQRFGQRDAKPAFGSRDDRPRGPKPAYSERGGKPAFGQRDSKPGFAGREDRPRGPKPAFGDRGGKPAFSNREDRPRGPKPAYSERGGKPAFGQRDAKPGFVSRDDRPRSPKPAFGDRGGKPAFGQRGTKPGFAAREDRPRGPRPGYSERGGKPAFGNREDRPRGPKPGFGKPEFSKPRPDRPQTLRIEPEDASSRPHDYPGRSGSGFRPQQRDAEPRFEQRADRGPSRQGDRPYSRRPDFDRSRSDQSRPSRPASHQTDDAPRRFERPEQRRDFDRPPRKSFDKPRGEGFSARPSGRFGKDAGKGRSHGPAQDRGQSRPQGSGPFRGEQKPRFGGKSKPPAGGSRPSFGAKSGFKRSGPPKRSGSPRSGGPSRGKRS